MAIRLDKYLAELGAGTRSEVKKMIKAKQVTINGMIVTKPEAKVKEGNDVVCLRGEQLTYAAMEYYLFHKPAGCVCATEDALHKTVMDYLTDTVRSDLFPVGRLDLDTEGLLLITNDGALSHALLSPAKHVPKTYYAKVRGLVTDEDVRRFKEGVDIGDEKMTKPATLVILKTDVTDADRDPCEKSPLSEIELTITEGRFHQVKRMFEAVGKEVVYLKRLSMGALSLPPELVPGEYRALTEEELAALKRHEPGKGE